MFLKTWDAMDAYSSEGKRGEEGCKITLKGKIEKEKKLN